ncbi:cation:proton antiporter [Aquimarina sp. ERC-38]|uniref:cation:proton antiporter n=1 Tax=Aquimarina sp. ERC-38 TaxID=2949996 RepID=UPI002247CC95|nr:cation:proton antiporter [Aquimarina sp. ERC-38]UZO81126.1 cation:proton antiporter [Aquimarina sp. ERC-38]
MEIYLWVTLLGFSTLLMAYLPILCQRLQISYTIPLLVIGMIIIYLVPTVEDTVSNISLKFVEKFSEIIVIISLMSAGLKIGLKYSWKEWRNPLALVGVAMPVCMLAIIGIGVYIMYWPLASALLLAAVLTPTDPVLASELQLEDQTNLDKKNTGLRYVLTGEAGINDGLAFPFVFMAILMSKADQSGTSFDSTEWFSFYLAYKIVAGVLLGAAIGYAYSWTISFFDKPVKNTILNGFVGISLTLFSYGFTEICQGYGFIAVFFTGLFAQYHVDKSKDDHPENAMVLFVEETEKFLVVIWILLFGAYMALHVFPEGTWIHILIAVTFVLLIRPVAGFLSIIKSGYTFKKKMAISFFGIRGIGSIFYLSYALLETSFESSGAIQHITIWTIFISIILHGLVSKRIISYFQKYNPG